MQQWFVRILMVGLIIWSIGQGSKPSGSLAAPTTQTFMDVPPEYIFYSQIEQLAAWQSIWGFPCGGANEPCDGSGRTYFRPQDPLLRKDMAKMVSFTKRYAATPTQQSYMDVPSNHEFYVVIEHMSIYGLILGTECGGSYPCDGTGRRYFLPDDIATRGVVAKVVSVAAGFNETPTTQTFTDVPPSHGLYPFIERLAVRGIASGVACGGVNTPCDGMNRRYFLPDDEADRGAAAKWISYLIPPTLPPTNTPTTPPILPPTNTPTTPPILPPTNTPTATTPPMPPTNTPTAVLPPTNTPTAVLPPTNTPVGPTTTPTQGGHWIYIPMIVKPAGPK